MIVKKINEENIMAFFSEQLDLPIEEINKNLDTPLSGEAVMHLGDYAVLNFGRTIFIPDAQNYTLRKMKNQIMRR